MIAFQTVVYAVLEPYHLAALQAGIQARAG